MESSARCGDLRPLEVPPINFSCQVYVFYTQNVEIGPKMDEIAKMAQNSIEFVWDCVKE